MAYSLEENDVEQLLGRGLSDKERTGFAAYIAVAKEQLEILLGFKLDGTANASRTYESREGFRSLVIDPFTAVSEVAIDNVVVTGYIKKQNDAYTADWFNTIQLQEAMGCKYVSVKATWGFGEELPQALRLLWAGMFDVVCNGQTKASQREVKSETTLSHSVTYEQSSEALAQFKESNALLINQYRNIPTGGLI